MSMDKIIREEARLIMLRTLDEQPSGQLNSALLQASLESFGIARTRDWVHEEMRVLADLGAIAVVEAGTVRVGRMTAKGADHVHRRIAIEGVKRPSPEV
jgi:hypothetical protein